MKHILNMKHILATALLILSAAAAALAFSQLARAADHHMSADEQAVRKFIDEISKALGRNDAAALERMYADSYTLVNEDGVVTKKEPRLAAIKTGELKYESVRFDDVSVRSYGDTAVVTYRAAIKGQSKGQAIGGNLRVTVTLVKMKGHWQVVAAQATRIAGA